MDDCDRTEADAEIVVVLGEDYPELRKTVRRICQKFPGEYWRELEARGYPTEFVAALTEAGYLGALIPRNTAAPGCRSGPLRDPRGDPRSGLHREPLPRPDVHHGHGAAARQRGAEAAYLPGIASRRTAPAGVRRDRADHRARDTTQLKTRAVRKGNDRYVVNGQKVWTSRVLQSDLMLLLARTTPRRRGQEAVARAVRVPGRPARGQRQGHRDQADRRHDQPQHHARCSSTTSRCRPRT